jgi:hypothetical protein
MADAKPAPLPTFTVAPGRSLVTDDGRFGPGETVSLDEKEGVRLRALGFLTAEDGSIVVRTDGPATTTGDVTIREQ